MPSLSEMLMPPKGMLNGPGAQAPQSSWPPSLQQHPTNAYGQMTGANPAVADPRETTPGMLNNYAPNRIPQDQQMQMAKAREFANMYKMVMNAKTKGGIKQKVGMLAAGIVNLGIQPPTYKEMYGPAVEQVMGPEQANSFPSPEEFADALIKDPTGELYLDVMGRMGQ